MYFHLFSFQKSDLYKLLKKYNFICKRILKLKINSWDNFIYKTIFGQFLLNKEIFGQLLLKTNFQILLKTIFIIFGFF